MMEAFLTQIIEILIRVTKGATMGIFVNWWREQTIANIKTTTTHDKVTLKAFFDGQIPHLLLSWTIVNRSLVDVKLKRMAGELYRGAWRIASFDSDRISESHIGYNWEPLIASQKNYLKKKGDKTEITITLFPSLEFWLLDINHYKCSLYNCIVEVSFSGGTAITQIFEDALLIEDAENIAKKYIDSMKTIIKTRWGF